MTRHGCVKTVVTEVTMSFKNAHGLRALWHHQMFASRFSLRFRVRHCGRFCHLHFLFSRICALVRN